MRVCTHTHVQTRTIILGKDSCIQPRQEDSKPLSRKKREKETSSQFNWIPHCWTIFHCHWLLTDCSKDLPSSNSCNASGRGSFFNALLLAKSLISNSKVHENSAHTSIFPREKHFPHGQIHSELKGHVHNCQQAWCVFHCLVWLLLLWFTYYLQ